MNTLEQVKAIGCSVVPGRHQSSPLLRQTAILENAWLLLCQVVDHADRAAFARQRET